MHVHSAVPCYYSQPNDKSLRWWCLHTRCTFDSFRELAFLTVSRMLVLQNASGCQSAFTVSPCLHVFGCSRWCKKIHNVRSLISRRFLGWPTPIRDNEEETHRHTDYGLQLYQTNISAKLAITSSWQTHTTNWWMGVLGVVGRVGGFLVKIYGNVNYMLAVIVSALSLSLSILANTWFVYQITENRQYYLGPRFTATLQSVVVLSQYYSSLLRCLWDETCLVVKCYLQHMEWESRYSASYISIYGLYAWWCCASRLCYLQYYGMFDWWGVWAWKIWYETVCNGEQEQYNWFTTTINSHTVYK